MADPSTDRGEEAPAATHVSPSSVDRADSSKQSLGTDGLLVSTVTLSPSLSPSPPPPPPSADESDGRNLYVDNLALTSDVELRNLFLPYGPILKSRLAIDPISRQPAGYGFVMFERREHALKAIEGLNQHVLGSKRLRVSIKRSKQTLTSQQQPGKGGADGTVAVAVTSSVPALPARPTPSSSSAASTASSPSSSSSPPSSSTNLYISGLPTSWCQSDVEALFARFGRIADSRLLLDRVTGQPRGVAMLRFESPANAAEAIAALHRFHTPAGMQQPITVKYATDKPAQRATPVTPLSSLSSSAQSAVTPVSATALLHRSPSSPHRSRLSASLSTALRGSPLIRLLHPSEHATPPPTTDADVAAGQNGVSPSPSTSSSLSSKSASPPPHLPLNDAASTDSSTPSTRTSSLSPTGTHSSSPPSTARRTSTSSSSSNGLLSGPSQSYAAGPTASAVYHTPTRGSASLSGGKPQSNSPPSYSPHTASRHISGVYAAGQQPTSRAANQSPLSHSAPPFAQLQQPSAAAYSNHSLAATHPTHPNQSAGRVAASGSGQTNRYSSVGLAASEQHPHAASYTRLSYRSDRSLAHSAHSTSHVHVCARLQTSTR